MCSTINRSRGRPYSPSGCPVQVGNTICGETQTLHIINEFKRLYENKMQEIDSSNCGDCLQEKLKLQQDWIGDLTEQNEMLVRAVEELEIEATERVKMLEDKLQRSAENINEVIKKYREYDSTNSLLEQPREKIFHLENDLKNLLEFLRRIREEQLWDSGGLVFYDLTENDLFGSKNNEESRSVKQFLNVDTVKGRRKLEEQENIIREMEKKIIEGVCLGKQLEIKKEECENLQKNMIDMRQALTEEVATKHDMILKLKKEVQELEERCIQADKQTAFRDDIIKELRKEIKQLKQQVSLPEKPYPKDSDIIRKDIKENLLIINHTNKKVTPEKSALLYLHHDEKANKTLINKSTATKVDTNFTNFTQCRSKFENATENLLIPECKSETNLKSRNPTAKGRSNLTASGGFLTRRNTFATSTIRDQKNSIPNHSPVKMFVNNLEINKSQKN